jgi:speckle-type POZ protein
MDDDWMKHFWKAATKQKFTDVEIFVGPVKVMEAHRIILSARSPVMDASLRKTRSTGKSTFTFGAELNVKMVKNFFKFLYTGLLESSASNKQLLELATQYKVETLKNICQLANGAPLDVEEFTNSMLQLA